MIRFRALGALAVLVSMVSHADVTSSILNDDRYQCVKASDGSVVTASAREDIVKALCAATVEKTRDAHNVKQPMLRFRYSAPTVVTPPAPTEPSTPTLPPPPPLAIRVNVGGPAYTDSAGNVWSADTGSNTGLIEDRPEALIAGTADQALYRNGRYDEPGAPELQYSFSLPAGKYDVKLLFAEANAGLYSVGARVFDVQLEGATAFADLDIFAQAGPSTALIKTAIVDVTDGTLNVGFVHKVDNPTVAAIAVSPVSSSTTPSASGSSMVSWVAPTKNTNGSPLTNLAGYQVLYGTTSPPTIVLDVPLSAIGQDEGRTSYEVKSLPPGRWYFAPRAVNSDGASGPLGNIVTKVIP